MKIHLADGEHTIDVAELESELAEDGYKLMAISATGELVIDDTKDPVYSDPDYAYRREVWQAMPEGAGADNTYWTDYPGGFEFCRSIKLTP